MRDSIYSTQNYLFTCVYNRTPNTDCRFLIRDNLHPVEFSVSDSVRRYTSLCCNSAKLDVHICYITLLFKCKNSSDVTLVDLPLKIISL